MKEVLIKKKLQPYEFYCDNCQTIHKMVPYAVAQLTMGHEIDYNCKCGNKIELHL